MLRNVSRLPCLFKHVALMPDAHLGKGSMVGSVVATKEAVIPATVGVDIGCGMMAVKTPFKSGILDGKLKELRLKIEEAIPTGFSAVQGVGRRIVILGRLERVQGSSRRCSRSQSKSDEAVGYAGWW